MKLKMKLDEILKQNIEIIDDDDDGLKIDPQYQSEGEEIEEVKKESNFNIIKDYELINYIGSGAFGQVFLCRHLPTGKKYAMKVQDKKMIDENKFLMFAKAE